MLMNLKMTGFFDKLASGAPAPGGGSVAALSGALAAGLIGMVCRLTAGKKGFEEHNDLMRMVMTKADAVSEELQKLVDQDTDAFNQVMAAFKMPKATDLENLDRRAAIQTAFKQAVNVPLGTVRHCEELLRLALKIGETANPNCISDLGVAGQTAWAGLNGAMMNVQINLPSIKDANFVTRTKKEAEHIVSVAEASCLELNGIVNRRLAG